LCYSTDRADQFRTAASYVDRILRAKPADLPVQAPTKYGLVKRRDFADQQTQILT
jgi:hypothetical protein